MTPGNAGDGSVAEDLIEDLIDIDDINIVIDDDGVVIADDKDGVDIDDDRVEGADRRTVYGDNAYGTGEFQQFLDDAGIDSRCKTQRPTAPGGMFAKDRFRIDLVAEAVCCPNGITVSIRRHRDGTGAASFAEHCVSCPLRAGCTTSKTGRQINVGIHEAALVRARERQQDPVWRDDYRATRPKVERKLAHLMRRRHGGRNARVRGTLKVDADFNLLAAAANFARLAVLGLHSTTSGWTVAG